MNRSGNRYKLESVCMKKYIGNLKIITFPGVLIAVWRLFGWYNVGFSVSCLSAWTQKQWYYTPCRQWLPMWESGTTQLDIEPRIRKTLPVIDLYLLQTGNEKTHVLWGILGWNHVLCWNVLSRTSNWREKWNFSQDFAQIQPNVAWQALLLKVFFLKIGAFVFTPPEDGHETWILQIHS